MLLNTCAISKRFGGEDVLHGVNLSLKEHTVLAVLGRSGSGKTTLLKIIAGLERADKGQVHLDGVQVDGTPAEKRNIVYLYQEPLLFPHLDVFENVAFGLRIRGADGIDKRVPELVEQLGLGEHLRKRPDQLSGGQRQRVAFARALIIRPRLLLLDEPFGALDGETRESMQELFLSISREHRIASVFVTHDLKEALIVGDRFAHLHRGHMRTFNTRLDFLDDEQIGASKEVEFWTSIDKSRQDLANSPN